MPGTGERAAKRSWLRTRARQATFQGLQIQESLPPSFTIIRAFIHSLFIYSLIHSFMSSLVPWLLPSPSFAYAFIDWHSFILIFTNPMMLPFKQAFWMSNTYSLLYAMGWEEWNLTSSCSRIATCPVIVSKPGQWMRQSCYKATKACDVDHQWMKGDSTWGKEGGPESLLKKELFEVNQITWLWMEKKVVGQQKRELYTHIAIAS